MVEGSYASGISTFPLPGMSIGKMVNNIAAKYPDNEALVSVHQNIRWTYREFLERVNQVDHRLMQNYHHFFVNSTRVTKVFFMYPCQ
jgi:fatty-acyl-CoA synthase